MGDGGKESLCDLFTISWRHNISRATGMQLSRIAASVRRRRFPLGIAGEHASRNEPKE
jgi:hypothetical protein